MSGPRCPSCDYEFDRCACGEPVTLIPLWRDDETWTEDAWRLDEKFRNIVTAFIKDNSEFKLRELEILMHGAISPVVVAHIMKRRLS